VEFAGEPRFPHTVVGVAVKGALPASELDALHQRLGAWRAHWSRPGRPGRWQHVAKLFLPPILGAAYRRLIGGRRDSAAP
jgi:hypothetical protein